MIIADTKADLYYSDIAVDMLNSAIKQPTLREWPSTVFIKGEKPLPTKSVGDTMGFYSSDQYVDGWLARIREELYSNPSVEDIFVDIEDNDVDIWVVIPERDLGILDQIVKAEGKLFDTLVSGESPPFLIDFHIIYRCGRNIEDLAPTRAIRLPRQVE